MSNPEDTPTLHQFPENISHGSMSSKKEYYDDVFGKFTDKFLLQKVDVNSDDDDGDYVKNYALCCIFLGILIMQMKDTAAEGDGHRNLINKKLLLSVLKAMGPYRKYANEMFVSIAQMECLLTPRLSEEFRWEFCRELERWCWS